MGQTEKPATLNPAKQAPEDIITPGEPTAASVVRPGGGQWCPRPRPGRGRRGSRCCYDGSSNAVPGSARR